MLMTDLTPADLNRLEKIARRRDADHLWDGMSPLHAELNAAKVLALVELARLGLSRGCPHGPLCHECASAEMDRAAREGGR